MTNACKDMTCMFQCCAYIKSSERERERGGGGGGRGNTCILTVLHAYTDTSYAYHVTHTYTHHTTRIHTNAHTNTHTHTHTVTEIRM